MVVCGYKLLVENRTFIHSYVYFIVYIIVCGLFRDKKIIYQFSMKVPFFLDIVFQAYVSVTAKLLFFRF